MNKTIKSVEVGNRAPTSNINWRSRFEEWLKWQGALEAFYGNVKNNTDLNYCFPSEDHSLWIIRAFEWDNTYEGSTYWSELNIEWQEYVENVEMVKEQAKKINIKF